MDTFFITLKIMGQGMAGIFVAALLISLVVLLLGRWK